MRLILEILLYVLLLSAGPWCFDYPRMYTGHVNVTVGGLPCRRWDSLPPLTFKHLPYQSWGFPEDIKDAANYCRNPDGDIWPWCFTEDPDVPYDFCSVEDLACHPDDELWEEITPVEEEGKPGASTSATHVNNTDERGVDPRTDELGSNDTAAVPRFTFQTLVAVVLYGRYLCCIM